jgi:endonuclease YncB( thermonuclease family)
MTSPCPALIVRVIDGDTLDAEVTLSERHISRHVKVREMLYGHVRLAGLDCPPGHTAEGKAAREFTDRWLRAVNYRVGVAFEPGRVPDPHGRPLVTVYETPAGLVNPSLNAALLMAKHARPWL